MHLIKYFKIKHLNFKFNYKISTFFWNESSLLDYLILLISENILKKVLIYSLILNLNLTLSENFLFKLYLLFFNKINNKNFFKNKINFIIYSVIIITEILILAKILLIF